jgi:hypothetical protein
MRISALTRRALCLLPMALPLAACNNAPIDPSLLVQQAALHAREIVHQTGGGVAFTTADDSGLQKMIGGMGHASDGLAGMAAAVPPGMMSAMSASPMAQAAAGMPSLSTTEEQFDDTADQLKTWLQDRVLADANLESKTENEAVYLLNGDPTCRALPHAGDPTGTIPALDTHCVDQLNKLQVRVALRADGDGVRLTIKVGPDQLELSAFVIHSDLLAVEVDLAKAYKASQFIDQTLGTDSPMGGTQFDALTGAVRLSLHKDGEKKATFAAAVLAPIDVAEKRADGAQGPEIKLAATDPVLSLTADGIMQTAGVKVNVGALDVWTNWSVTGTTAAANRDLHVAVGALTGESTFKEGIDELTAKGLGIGATTVQVRGATIFDLGLNPNDMRRFDLKVTLDAGGQPRFEITPRFDLSLGFHLGLVATDLSSAPPSYALDETYSLRLDNGGAPATVSSAPATATFGGGVKVGAGTLTLASSKVAEPITVPAGKCLTGVSMPPADSHPILGALAVVDCP